MKSSEVISHFFMDSPAWIFPPTASNEHKETLEEIYARLFKKKVVSNAAKKSATNQPFKPQPSQSWTWTGIPTLARTLTVVVQFMS